MGKQLYLDRCWMNIPIQTKRGLQGQMDYKSIYDRRLLDRRLRGKKQTGRLYDVTNYTVYIYIYIQDEGNSKKKKLMSGIK